MSEGETMRRNSGAQYEISIDGIPRTYRDQKDIAMASAQFLKARNPQSVVPAMLGWASVGFAVRRRTSHHRG
jgi:hypothetical protein